MARKYRVVRKGLTTVADRPLTPGDLREALGPVKRTQDVHTEQLVKVTATLNEHTEQLVKVTATLNEHSEQLLKVSAALSRMDRKLDALGSRWGIHAEAAFREAMREILSARGVQVSVWKAHDSAGHVFGRPSDIEVDVLLSNGRPTLIEIKSSLSDGDVAKLLRIGELYERSTGQKPDLAAVCPFITEAAWKLAKASGLKIYTDESTVPATGEA